MRQLEYWNDYAGPSWADSADGLEQINGAMGAAAIAAAAPAPGERVLDVGCGTGATTLAIAEAVGPTGRAVGLDLSAPMIAEARRRLARTGLSWAEFVEDDIETAVLPSKGFDLVFSRMCLMLLDDPRQGGRTIYDTLSADGRLVATVFRSMADNPWLPLVVMGAATSLSGLPPLPGPDEPGPFAFAEPGRITEVVEGAGFRAVEIAPLDTVVRPDGTPEQVAELLIQLGPAGGAYRKHDETARRDARQAVEGLLQRFRQDDGRLALPNASWLITARR